jgi:hypothetical protein
MYTLEQTLEQLGHAVAAYGYDWVDPNHSTMCKYSYTHGGMVRHCLAGWVVENYAGGANQLVDGDVIGLQKVVRDNYDDPSVRALDTAQTMQDSGYSWGESLEHVKSVLND